MLTRISVLFLIAFNFSSSFGQAPSSVASIDPDVLLVRGKILDEKTRQPVSAEVDIFYDNDFIVEDIQVANHGEYAEHIKSYGWYIIQISSPGYLNQTDTIWVTDDKRKVVEREHYMKPIEIGLSVVLHDVYFYFGKTILREESYPALNEVAAFFKANPQITFEIGGHTDDEGADDYNMMLSEGRAKAVVDYLSKQGIPSSQIKARGYGETKPIDTGITKAAKARNRRVEFVVVDIDMTKPVEN